MKPLVLLALVSLPVDASAKCAPSSLRAAVLTPADAAMLATGGIVVGAESFFDDGKIAEGNVVVRKDWRFKAGKRVVTPVIEIVAPGLAVYRWKGKAQSFALEDGNHALVASPSLAKNASFEPRPLADPTVKEVVSKKWRGRKPSTEVEILIDGWPPSDAVAIIAYDDKGKALSWGPITREHKSRWIVYGQHRCETLPDGTVEPVAGQKLRFAWVDANGRVSEKSRPRIVGEKIEGTGDE